MESSTLWRPIVLLAAVALSIAAFADAEGVQVGSEVLHNVRAHSIHTLEQPGHCTSAKCYMQCAKCV
jgi:predicted lipoprotein with Yx(FWY)xxD motif